MTEILMPALSPTMEEGGLAKWLVKPGDKISAGQVIAEIETDKATMEVEAVDEGVLEAILVEAGAQGVKVNTPIARLRGEGAPAKAPAPIAPQPASQAAPAAEAKAPQPMRAAAQESGERQRVSPLAKRMAAQAGIDLSGLSGSGPHGRIVRADIEQALNRPKAKPAETGAVIPFRAATQAVEPAKPTAMPFKAEEYDTIPLDGMRRAIARRMTQAFRDIPHFPLTIDVEIDRLLELRKNLNTRLEGEGVKLSVNDLLIRACALGLKRVPEANASFAGDAILRHKHAHIAVAVAIPGGLVTPVIFKAETKGMAEISQEVKLLAEKARARKLLPQDYEGGTFSISNLGMYGIKSFASILNEPQAMILSVGVGEPRPVVRNNEIKIATIMTLTLTCDHRAVDGAIGADFLSVLRRSIEDPMTMML
jgi:pyruvate dehydrogenase E2 component (dihydrolipoamide acetyltransferase)